MELLVVVVLVIIVVPVLAHMIPTKRNVRKKDELPAYTPRWSLAKAAQETKDATAWDLEFDRAKAKALLMSMYHEDWLAETKNLVRDAMKRIDSADDATLAYLITEMERMKEQ